MPSPRSRPRRGAERSVPWQPGFAPGQWAVPGGGASSRWPASGRAKARLPSGSSWARAPFTGLPGEGGEQQAAVGLEPVAPLEDSHLVGVAPVLPLEAHDIAGIAHSRLEEAIQGVFEIRSGA